MTRPHRFLQDRPAVTQRYFSERRLDLDPSGNGEARLTDAEAHHFLHVMRGGAGDRVTLFDGSGREFDAEVVQASRREVTLTLLACQDVDREVAAKLILGVALPKGDRQKVLVEKLTEVGVVRVVPLVTEHAVAVPKASALAKLRRLVIESSKQCRRNRLMEIAEPAAWADLLASASGERWIAHPGGPPLAPSDPDAEEPITLAIGPEGGFADAEVRDAEDAGWRVVSLGRRILRIETAAIVLAASRAIDAAGG